MKRIFILSLVLFCFLSPLALAEPNGKPFEQLLSENKELRAEKEALEKKIPELQKRIESLQAKIVQMENRRIGLLFVCIFLAIIIFFLAWKLYRRPGERRVLKNV